MAWWLDNNFRIIQNNLRDIDAKMDIDKHIQWLKEFDCNVLMTGCGGITAFYPTKLEYQYQNPYMTDDFFGTLLDKCHQNGIRVIARFDFSKLREEFFIKRPEWFSKSVEGEYSHYNGMVPTCINGGYQQNYSLEIIREVLEKYPVDGIFFNMFGYQTRDYDDKYIGICQCDNCKRRFKEMYGETLPTVEDPNDPVFQKYKEFKLLTTREILENIHKLTKGINPDVAISTYNDYKIDMVRNEANSAVDRPYPHFLYNASENVDSIENSYEDKVSSNCAINAVDIPYRFMGVSKFLNQIRLYESIASGGALDWCIIGAFDGYPDEENYELTQEVFHFHKQYEKFFGHFENAGNILLVKPSNSMTVLALKEHHEYMGIYKMLKEEHRIFQVIKQEQLESKAQEFDQYDFIIIPGIQMIENENVIKKLQSTTAAVIATGNSMKNQTEVLKSLFGVSLGEEMAPVRGSYFLKSPESVFTTYQKRKWVYLDREYRHMKTDKENENILPVINPTYYGPPELCFGHDVSAENFGITLHSNDEKTGKKVYMPWKIGELYYNHGYEDFKYILMNLMDYMKPKQQVIETNLPKSVEVFFHKCGDKQYILQLLNLSGYNGTTFSEWIPIHDIEVKINLGSVKEVYELRRDNYIKLDVKEKIKIEKLDNYKAFIIEMV